MQAYSKLRRNCAQSRPAGLRNVCGAKEACAGVRPDARRRKALPRIRAQR